MTLEEEALTLYAEKKYNCAQAVASVLCQNMNIDPALVLRSCEGFGYGMGCAKCTCGAVSGAAYAIGMKNSDGNLDGPAKKTSTYKLVSQLVEQFSDENGYVICQSLKSSGPDKTPVPCKKCITDAVKFAYKIICDADATALND